MKKIFLLYYCIGIFTILISHAQTPKNIGIPNYYANKVDFYLGTATTPSGTMVGLGRNINGLTFFGSDMFVAGESSKILWYSGVSFNPYNLNGIFPTSLSTGSETIEVVADANGNIYVANANGTITKFFRASVAPFYDGANKATVRFSNDFSAGLCIGTVNSIPTIWVNNYYSQSVSVCRLSDFPAVGTPTTPNKAPFVKLLTGITNQQNEGIALDATGALWVASNGSAGGYLNKVISSRILTIVNSLNATSNSDYTLTSNDIEEHGLTGGNKLGSLTYDAIYSNIMYVNDQPDDGSAQAITRNILAFVPANMTANNFSTPITTPYLQTNPGNGQAAIIPCSLLPTPIASSPTIGSGQTAALTASNCVAGATYQWKDGATIVSTNASFTTPALNANKVYTVSCVNSSSCIGAATNVTVTIGSVNPTVDNHIKIDQFGYRPSDKKIAIISKAITGFNSPDAFSPSSGTNQYQVRRVSDDVAVLSGTITPWNGGNTHPHSGDKAWWFDFSSLNVDGDYYIYDVGLSKKSYNFKISNDVYSNITKQAIKDLYYQRCGVAKTVANGGAWNDVACHLHTNQDLDCWSGANQIASTSKDLSGGWHDAGDYNKYVNFALPAVHDLLFAYEEKPMFWGDNSNIPESSNGFPDILDELKVELDWFLKMQQADGSVLSKVSTLTYSEGSPASSSTTQRYYAPANTTSAYSFASMLAHASLVYRTFPAMQTYANTLKTAAINAYAWAKANPNVIFSNDGYASADVDGLFVAYDRTTALPLTAAVYLYNLTGNTEYKTFVESNYTNMYLIQNMSAYEYEATYQDALLYYANLPAATPAVTTAINNAYKTGIDSNNADNLPNFNSNGDAYRAYMQYFPFNSNHDANFKGLLYQNSLKYNLNAANNQNYKDASLGFLNYVHGVNPLAKTYLSNASLLGAENSVNEIYHGWFGDGTIYDGTVAPKIGPPPGFLVCGADEFYVADNGNALLTPPAGQPAEKSYLDFNNSLYTDASWTNSEVAIYNQATYARLAEKFIIQSTAVTGVTYCMPTSPSGGIYLTGVTLNGKVLSQNSGFSENGYALFASNAIALTKGNTYGFSTQKNVTNAHSQSIWIDYNRDGDFDDAGENIDNYTLSTGGATSFVVSNAATTSVGYTRMRIRVRASGTPNTCTDDAAIQGETEDYIIELISCITPPNPTSASASPSAITPGQTTTLTASGCPTGTTYLWKVQDIAGPQLYDASSSASFTSASISTTTNYFAYCANGSCISTGVPVTVTVLVVNAPTISANPSFGTTNYPYTAVCAASPTILSATGCSGTVTWYFGTGVAIGTGTSFVYTPPANSSTPAIYANCTIGTQSSGASNYIAVQNPPAAPSLIANPSTITRGNSSTLSAAGCLGTGTITWNTGATGASITVSPTSTTVYTATCSDGTCTSTATSQTITVWCPPVYVVNGSSPTTTTITGTQSFTAYQDVRTFVNSGLPTELGYVFTYIGNTANVTFQGGRSVTLNPGFSTKQGAVFEAKIGDCLH